MWIVHSCHVLIAGKRQIPNPWWGCVGFRFRRSGCSSCFWTHCTCCRCEHVIRLVFRDSTWKSAVMEWQLDGFNLSLLSISEYCRCSPCHRRWDLIYYDERPRSSLVSTKRGHPKFWCQNKQLRWRKNLHRFAKKFQNPSSLWSRDRSI